jgi:hypothetical protein
MQHKQLHTILRIYQIIGYFRYVDGFIIYDQNKTNIVETLAEFNKQRTGIKFTIEKEKHNSINFLDLTIHRKITKLEFAIYIENLRKQIP